MAALSPPAGLPANIFKTAGRVRLIDRQRLFGHGELTLWLTGLSGAGKSTIAYELETRLVRAGFSAVVLDGDNLRHGLNRNLGFSAAERQENIRRVAEVARLMNDAGLIVVCACISPLRADRDMAREIVGERRFAEVYVSTPLAVCEARDCKGLYAKARAGEIAQFTGVSAPYEPPPHPALTLDAGALRLDESVDSLFGLVLHCCSPAAIGERESHDYRI
ncbi:adenylyl-sulfate kinase [Chromobacterium alticapitis]|uniref:Adenylyl-sulfate kinase n=1 Tax=Chromobacterium alticapitis TaxID=2073169 RepID=A0A2S5DEB2_9NEIS|nr:adenylyl-sulfate kinase [Chromobacterium alticapitis]POZ61436.1 adenylyl-sulfate kinase [Chromobacterium alticapitis]